MNKGLTSLLIGAGALAAPQLAYADDTAAETVKVRCAIVETVTPYKVKVNPLVRQFLPTSQKDNDSWYSHTLVDGEGNKIDSTLEHFNEYEVGSVINYDYFEQPAFTLPGGSYSLIVNINPEVVGKIDEEGRLPGICFGAMV